MLPNALRPSATDHIPVLADEVRRLLDVQPGAAVVDATFGAGGHAELLALDMRGKGRFIAIDRDPSARQYFERFRKRAGVQARFLRGEFATVLDQLATNDVRVDAILLDLGVSSMQVDRPERGFSYAVDAPLDMRMDPSADETAADIVNDAPERELQEIFRRYGEERYARQIARAITRRRRREPFVRSGELVDVIKTAIPTPARFGEGHPARRVFQALRIAVNDELGQLEEALPAAIRLLRPHGRIAVISFHSLEDRIVKRYFRAEARGCVCPPDFPVCACGKDPVLRVLTTRAVRPGRTRGGAQSALRHQRGCASRRRSDGSYCSGSTDPADPSTAAQGEGEGAAAAPRSGGSRAGSSGSSSSPALLAGVVALNVAVLRVNLAYDELGQKRSKLRAENAALASQLASAASTGRIQKIAAEELGATPALPDQTTYVVLPR